MIKALIFDFGGVVIDVKLATFYNELAKHSNGLTHDYFYTTILAGDLQKGTITLAQLHARLANEIKLTLSFKAFTDLWFYIVQEPNKNIIPILHSLKEKYPLYLLSNTESFNAAQLHTKIPNVFTKCYFSYELGMAKPDKEIYEYVLKDIHCAADECIFIDDLAINIAGAEKVGIHTIHYTLHTDLAQELHKYGVLLKKE